VRTCDASAAPRALLPAAWPASRTIATADTSTLPPYSDAEVAVLLRFSDALPSSVFCIRGLAYVLLGVAAGLVRQDMGHVDAGGIRRADDGAVEVAVGDDRPRVVPVLDRYADRLLSVVHDAGDGLLLAIRSAKGTATCRPSSASDSARQAAVSSLTSPVFGSRGRFITSTTAPCWTLSWPQLA
jgi:hypothetical protein